MEKKKKAFRMREKPTKPVRPMLQCSISYSGSVGLTMQKIVKDLSAAMKIDGCQETLDLSKLEFYLSSSDDDNYYSEYSGGRPDLIVSINYLCSDDQYDKILKAYERDLAAYETWATRYTKDIEDFAKAALASLAKNEERIKALAAKKKAKADLLGRLTPDERKLLKV